MSATYYAHSLEGRPVEEWHVLEQHLADTAELAERFARTFAPGWGRLAGLWHDAGKYQRAFQARIDPDAHVNERVDHSSVGALVAIERKIPWLAFPIAGHHGGMANAEDLKQRIRAKRQLLADARLDGLPASVEEQNIPDAPSWLQNSHDGLSLWLRFLFSALVDADFLDTEKFYARGMERDLGSRPGLSELDAKLAAHLEAKAAGAPPTAMNAMRARALEACRRDASDDPGAFTLTVPTGGGKTLASLAFALDHAVKYRLRRVIVVIPFTSIIEQTAKAYRDVLGDDAIIEHHTNVDPDKETRLNRLASDNWDAPIVVTTAVQFFESLFANRPSRCRKLHRIAGSVIVFDEVQTFPVKLLQPVKHVLRELAGHYRSTTQFCTATQPVLFPGVRELIPNPESEFAAVARRCEVLMPENAQPVQWETLAEEVAGKEQVMAIVHRRDDAQRLAQLAGEECLHLSARMCAKHRSKVLDEVRRRLQQGETCRLVSTQLVEAGVDVDFPEVYRAFAGADSLAQAAGRCNREGKGSGRLHVFIAPTKPPAGILRTAEETALTMWREGRLDLTRAATFREYFDRLYRMADQDARDVMSAERGQSFKDVAEQFRMIDEAGQPVVAPYGDWQGRVEDVRRLGISRTRMRRLQPFMVNLYVQEIKALVNARAIERIADAFWAVVPGFRVYSERWGFGWQGGLLAEPEDLIA